jgi:hypothetical protein
LPDDLEPVTLDKSWVALLPLLDSTVMGWRRREFYLGGHGPQLSTLPATPALRPGSTAAWSARGRKMTTRPSALDPEAERLTDWLGGQRVFPVYPSPTMREPTR